MRDVVVAADARSVRQLDEERNAAGEREERERERDVGRAQTPSHKSGNEVRKRAATSASKQEIPYERSTTAAGNRSRSRLGSIVHWTTPRVCILSRICFMRHDNCSITAGDAIPLTT